MPLNISAVVSRITPLRAGVLIALASFLFVSIVFNVQPRGWAAWYRLAVFGRQTEATILRRQPDYHESCSFEYVANSVRYEGTDQSCQFEVGQRVMITYLPTDPSFATTASPVRHLALSILGPLSLCILAGVGTAWRVRHQRSRLAL